jgi:glycosyltransferase involved in cell wall biosynthesis
MNLLRIAFLTEKYPPDMGGLAISCQRLAQALAAAGHDVHVISATTAVPPGQVVHTQRDGVTIHRLGATTRTDDTLAEWFRYLVATHSQAPFDLLHAYFVTQAGFLATYAGHYLGIPSVISARGNDLDHAIFEPRRASHILYALHHANAITANTHDLVRKAQALAPGRSVRYIPNGVDTTHFTPTPEPDETRPILPALQSLPVLGFAGEARTKKGLATLLMAYRQIAARRPAGLLLVGGVRSGDDKDMLKVFQKQHPILPLVMLPDVAPESMPAYYRMFDILLLPSLHDGLPNALLEGMACGRAIIATPVGGMADVMEDGVNGLLVPPGNAEALTSAVERLIDDPDLRQHLGHHARQTVVRSFTPARELEENLRLYAELGATGQQQATVPHTP